MHTVCQRMHSGLVRKCKIMLFEMHIKPQFQYVVLIFTFDFIRYLGATIEIDTHIHHIEREYSIVIDAINFSCF